MGQQQQASRPIQMVFICHVDRSDCNLGDPNWYFDGIEIPLNLIKNIEERFSPGGLIYNARTSGRGGT
jgi:hypothetical protein